MARLSVAQTYELARTAGFPPDTARKMVAIAQRESSLNPNVVGTINAAKERSYGLWQINLKDPGIRNLMAANGITESNILDPLANARAAFLLWGGSDRNLETAWYVNRRGSQYGYAEKFEENLSRLPGLDVLEGSTAPAITQQRPQSGGAFDLDFAPEADGHLLVVGAGLLGLAALMFV